MKRSWVIRENYANRAFNPSYIKKISALLGTDRATVMPHPAYSPRRPRARYSSFATVPNDLGPANPADAGRSSASVCIVLLIVSAGKNARLYAAPAHAPLTALSHGQSSRVGASRRRTLQMSSLVPNQAAEPPVSRMSVPVWPNQSPRTPSVRMASRRMASGPGRFRGREAARVGWTLAADDAGGATSICTCILHFTSSIGVLCSCKTMSTHRGAIWCGKEKDNAQKVAGYGASTCSCEGQLREGEHLRGGDARESSNEVLQLVICEEQDRVFGHGADYRGG